MAVAQAIDSGTGQGELPLPDRTLAESVEPYMFAPPVVLGQSASNPPWRLFDLHTDHLGSVRLVTNDYKQVISRHDFFPFGEEVETGITYNTHAFTGHEQDGATELLYMMARSYSPSAVRFLSTDPLPGTPDSPQSWAAYSYVQGNPLGFVDPTGMYIAPGTPVPPTVGPAGPVGPCYVCSGANSQQGEKIPVNWVRTRDGGYVPILLDLETKKVQINFDHDLSSQKALERAYVAGYFEMLTMASAGPGGRPAASLAKAGVKRALTQAAVAGQVVESRAALAAGRSALWLGEHDRGFIAGFGAGFLKGRFGPEGFDVNPVSESFGVGFKLGEVFGTIASAVASFGK